jgi:hypothetical protein
MPIALHCNWLALSNLREQQHRCWPRVILKQSWFASVAMDKIGLRFGPRQ